MKQGFIQVLHELRALKSFGCSFYRMKSLLHPVAREKESGGSLHQHVSQFIMESSLLVCYILVRPLGIAPSSLDFVCVLPLVRPTEFESS